MKKNNLKDQHTGRNKQKMNVQECNMEKIDKKSKVVNFRQNQEFVCEEMSYCVVNWFHMVHFRVFLFVIFTQSVLSYRQGNTFLKKLWCCVGGGGGGSGNGCFVLSA